MEFSMNDAPILSATIDMPLRGAWTADVVVDCDVRERVLGAVQLDNAEGTWTLKGTSRLGDVDLAGKAVVRVVGGAGGLAKPLDPKFYRDMPASTVVADAIEGGDETLSSDSDSLQTKLECWTRMKTTVSQELDAIVDALGLEWRVLSNGSIWIGSESWPESATTYDYLEEHPEDSRVIIGPDAPTLVPGTTFLGRAVVHVTHTISPGSLRTEVLFER
jgi:hypothetical protein